MAAQTAPELPRVYIDTTYVAPTGQTIAVAAGGDVQGALNSAALGDVITLAAGATYTGNFTLPKKSGSGWIIVRSSTADGNLPAPGTRIAPSYASVMPKLVSNNSDPVLDMAAGAHHFRFIGVEFKVAAGNYVDTLIHVGSGSDTSASTLPHDIIFDRCYVHGDPVVGSKRGLGLNGGATAIIDSYFSDWKGQGFDTQAIAGWNGSGPFKIVNNYLEAAGENFIYGGADPQIPNMVASDIEIRRNYFNKPVSWNLNNASTYAGKLWSVKNLLELKNTHRVVVDGNLMEHTWEESQAGYGILLTPRNQDGTAPWSGVQDVTITNNIVRHVKGGVQMLGWDNDHPSQQLLRVRIANNLFDDVGAPTWGVDGDGRLFQPEDGSADIVIEHNTAFQTGAVIAAGGRAHTGWYYRNNLTMIGAYGVIGTGTGSGSSTLSTYFPGIVFQKNVLVGGNASDYPAGNFFPASISSVGFVGYSSGNYRLSSTSPYKNAGTDGKDVGADLDAINAAMAGSSPPPPPPPGNLTVSFANPASGATVSGTTTVTTSATGGSGYTYTVRADGSTVYSGTNATFSWNTTTATNGSHTLTTNVVDASGKTGSASRTVTVSNTSTGALSVAITQPQAPATSGATASVAGTVSVAASVSGATGSSNTFTFVVNGTTIATKTTSGTSVSVPWNTTLTSNGTRTLTVTVKDAAGHTGSASESVSVKNGTATQALVASFTNPAGGANVSGTTNVAVSVSGPTAPSHTFKLMVGSTVIGTKTVSGTTATFSWVTTSAANGSQTLSVTVTDPSARTGSNTRKVTVANTAPAGTLSVSLTQATTNLLVSGGTYATVSVTGTSGSSNVYTLSIGTTVLSQQTTSSTGPVILAWDSATVANGTHTLKALVTDAGGNTGSKTLNIQVAN